MADQTPTTVALSTGQAGTIAGIYTATVTSADTVTITNFTDILNAYVIDLSDNSEATATLGTNVVSISQLGLVTQKVLIFAQGT